MPLVKFCGPAVLSFYQKSNYLYWSGQHGVYMVGIPKNNKNAQDNIIVEND